MARGVQSSACSSTTWGSSVQLARWCESCSAPKILLALISLPTDCGPMAIPLRQPSNTPQDYGCRRTSRLYRRNEHPRRLFIAAWTPQTGSRSSLSSQRSHSLLDLSGKGEANICGEVLQRKQPPLVLRSIALEKEGEVVARSIRMGPMMISNTFGWFFSPKRCFEKKRSAVVLIVVVTPLVPARFIIYSYQQIRRYVHAQ